MFMGSQIHSTAIVSPKSHLGNRCKVGAYAIVEDGVTIGEKCDIEAHAVIKKGTVLGNNVRVGHFSVLGGDPQHLKFDRSIDSIVQVSNDVRIGEGVTIHRSMYANGVTKIGARCFLMGHCHVGHDGELRDEVILANGALLGGHVSVGDFTFIGGGAGIHQFIRIGGGAMIGGLAEVSRDVPPHVTVAGRNQSCGLNLTGIKRRKISKEETRALKYAYRQVLMKGGNPTEIATNCITEQIIKENPKAKEFVEFFLTESRGFIRSRSLLVKS